jgi:Tfp pilus assembly protein PilF
MLETRTGNTLSCESSEAANLYQEAVDLILGSESGAAETLDKALEPDKNFALAAAARYYVAKDIGEPDADVFRELAEQASLNATDWEREHADVLIGLMDRPRDAQGKALAYIKTTPTDLLVISQLTGTMFFYDGPQKLETVLNVFESVEAALGDDWAFLARLGFAASEAGQRKRGRELIERALDIRPQALYSIHGLAHVLHDEGVADESAKLIQDWLKVHGSSARNGQMYGHVQWHLALSEWQVGDRESAMRRYLEYCAPETTTCGPILTLADCGGFLLRDYLQSGQTSALGNDVLKHIDRVWKMMGHPFIALHVAGLYASAGDLAGLKRCEETISGAPSGANRDVSLALVSSLSDFVTGNYQQATQTLATISPGARIGIGGSNVERILVDLIETRSKALH